MTSMNNINMHSPTERRSLQLNLVLLKYKPIFQQPTSSANDSHPLDQPPALPRTDSAISLDKESLISDRPLYSSRKAFTPTNRVLKVEGPLKYFLSENFNDSNGARMSTEPSSFRPQSSNSKSSLHGSDVISPKGRSSVKMRSTGTMFRIKTVQTSRSENRKAFTMVDLDKSSLYKKEDREVSNGFKNIRNNTLKSILKNPLRTQSQRYSPVGSLDHISEMTEKKVRFSL